MSLFLVTTRAVADFASPERSCHPQTWFHLIGGNVSTQGLTADLEAIAGAGISGIQLFHGQRGPATAWPRTHGQIPCLSTDWDRMIVHAADECARLGLKFEMQNCPGWSMSGGPWITHETAMRKLVAFRPDRKPAFGPDDDYREIGEVTFPKPAGWDEPEPKLLSRERQGDVETYVFERPFTLRQITLGDTQAYVRAWAYEHWMTIRLEAETPSGWRLVFDRPYPRGCWQDGEPVRFACPPTTARRFRLTMTAQHALGKLPEAMFSPVAHLDGWEALAGHVLRDLPAPGSAARFYRSEGERVRLVFGHVNLKMKNAPAPAEATGWECDKLDAKGFRANFDAYLGRLVRGPLSGGKLKGLVVDSWECRRQTWTFRLEEYFRRLNGYELRPHLPEIFGFSAGDPRDSETFLRDWRRTLSTLIEENYYRVIGELGRANGLTVQFETAFGDVVPGDILRYWKYADIPMCEFWQPFDNAKGSVGSDDYKPVRACVSAAHVYGKTRVQTESLTNMKMTWNENFQLFKDVVDRYLARGVTHVVFHTYTHNPQVGTDFLPPGTSFGGNIGTPFLRGQTWWKFMPELTHYLARCCQMLEWGKPVVDVLWYLGDDLGHRPPENAEFPAGYKYDYCNRDVLKTRLGVKDGRWCLPDGMHYRVLWIPDGTFLLPETERLLAGFAAQGGRVVRGPAKPDWQTDLSSESPEPLPMWYHRQTGGTNVYFLAAGARAWTGTLTFREGPRLPVALQAGETVFVMTADGSVTVLDPVAGRTREPWREELARGRFSRQPITLRPLEDYPFWALERTYLAKIDGTPETKRRILDLGEVYDIAEVSVNGKNVATLWSKPYVCNLAGALESGENEVRVKVTSSWHNRLLHEARLPESERTSWTLCGPAKDAAPRPAGLIGPSWLFE